MDSFILKKSPRRRSVHPIHALKSLESEFSDYVIKFYESAAQSKVLPLRSRGVFFQVGKTKFCASIFWTVLVAFERSQFTDFGMVYMLGVHWPGTRSFFQDKLLTRLRPVPPIHTSRSPQTRQIHSIKAMCVLYTNKQLERIIQALVKKL